MMVSAKLPILFFFIGSALGRKEFVSRRQDRAHAHLARRNDGADPLRYAAQSSSPGYASSSHTYATDVTGMTGVEMTQHAPKGFFIGASVDDADLRMPEMAKVAKAFNYWTPGNALKMSEIYEGEWNWDNMQTSMAKFVPKSSTNWKYHTVIWGAQQNPKMMAAAGKDKAKMMQLISDFVSQRMCTKIIKEGQFFAIDVLNEIFNDQGTNFKNNGYFEVIGEQGYKDVIAMVHKNCPGYKLIVNEYGMETVNPKSNFAFKTIKSWIDQGVPLDAVGLQFHINLDIKYEDMLAAIQRWTKAGIPVVLSEIDVPVNLPASKADLEKQAQQYGNVFQAALEGGAFGATVWGTMDKTSWFAPAGHEGVGHGKLGKPLLFDDAGNPKPAVAAIVDVFKKWGNKPVGIKGVNVNSPPKTGYTAPQTPYSAPKAPYTAPQTHYTAPKAPYTAPKAPYTAPKAPYTAPKTGYTAPKADKPKGHKSDDSKSGKPKHHGHQGKNNN